MPVVRSGPRASNSARRTRLRPSIRFQGAGGSAGYGRGGGAAACAGGTIPPSTHDRVSLGRISIVRHWFWVSLVAGPCGLDEQGFDARVAEGGFGTMGGDHHDESVASGIMQSG